ncbi:MAG: glycosyltransferase family 4 protein [Thermodesulfobacteriota bacterium]
MKRVLLVSNNFPPTIGGPATFVDALGHELARRDFRVTVLCTSAVARDPDDAARPFVVRRVCLANRYRYEVAVRVALLRELARHRLVFVNTLEDYLCDVNRLLRRRYVLKVVGDTVWERARNLGATCLDVDAFQTDGLAQRSFRAAIERRNRAVLGAAHVVTPSAYLRRMVIGWGVPEERVTVVANGVDEDFATAETPAPRPGAELRVLFVGRLTNWKGVDTLLLALARVEGARLVVAGDGPQLPSLVALARQLGVADRVRFAGAAPRARVRELMRESDVLVLASLYEGMSHTLLEAAALGLPAIASRCGGNPEVVCDGDSGILVPPQDVAALRAALVTLRDDEALRHRLALAAHGRARGHRVADGVPRIVELIDALAA